MVGRHDLVAFQPSARLLAEIVPFHPGADLLDLLAIKGVLAEANLEAVVFGWVMARGNLNPAVDIEMKQRKIEQRRGTNAVIVDMQTRRNHAVDNRLGIRIGGRAAVAPDSDPLAAPGCDGRAVHLAEQQRKLLVEIFFRQAADVVFAKDGRVHRCFRRERWRASRAAKRIASFMLVASALPVPAMS